MILATAKIQKFKNWEIFKFSWVNTQENLKISLGPTGNGLKKNKVFIKAVASRAYGKFSKIFENFEYFEF